MRMIFSVKKRNILSVKFSEPSEIDFEQIIFFIKKMLVSLKSFIFYAFLVKVANKLTEEDTILSRSEKSIALAQITPK